MNTDKMNLNELEQANGGNFVEDVKPKHESVSCAKSIQFYG